MRKLSMKRKSGRRSGRVTADHTDNSVDEKNKDNGETSVEGDTGSDLEESYEPEKKRRSGKRKSVSFSAKNKETSDSQYEVESVLGEKSVKGVKHYLIRWKGYGPESDTWEPESTLNCNELIKEFHASSGGSSKTKTEKKVHKTKNEKKSGKPEASPAAWSETEEFEVDRILEVHHKRDGSREFLVSWKGYPSSQNSWEPEENMTCADLIEKFMAKVEKAKESELRELREKRTPTHRFTLNDASGGRRLSKRNRGKERVQYHDSDTKENNRLKSNLELQDQDCSASDDDLNKSSAGNASHLNVDTKHEADTVSCYCSASHTDNISTDEHDSLRDSHIGQVHFKGLHSSDSGTDLTEYKHDYDNAWQKYWSLHGETIIWKSWIAKYSAYINPDYLDYGSQCSDQGAPSSESSNTNKERIKSLRFCFDEKDIEQVNADSNLETIDERFILSDNSSSEKQEISCKNRMLIRNLSGSDSYDKLHTEISEGWNPLSPASVEYEAEAERLLSSRCGSHASSSHRTVDSMTNVTRMTVSSFDFSQSSDSFSSVSSVQTSSNSSTSEEIEDADFEQQWNVLWKKHYEEEYLQNYNKFMCSHTEGLINQEKRDCVEGQLEQKFETLTMDESAKANFDSCFVEETLLEGEMLTMGLPTSFGTKKQTTESEPKKDSGARKRRHEGDGKEDESSVSKMKASFSLIGIEYQDDDRSKFVGTVEYKKKNIRFQNRQLKMQKGTGKQPKHTYFDDDGNVISSSDVSTLQQQSSTSSSDLKDTCSSDEADADIAKPCILPLGDNNTEKSEAVAIKRKRRKKKIVLPAEIKDNPHLIKYWYKRFSLFSKFDLGVQLDEESWFSVTPESVAKHHANRFKKFSIIVDGFCGVGGNTIQFAAVGLKVIAIDIDPLKIERARHNARIYDVADNIEFIVGDFLQLAETIKADAVFLSPPWGGPSYLKRKIYDLDTALQPVPFTELMNCAKKISNNIGIFLPRNSNTHTLFVSGLGGKVDVEQNFLNNKLIALTAYYNDLIPLQ